MNTPTVAVIAGALVAAALLCWLLGRRIRRRARQVARPAPADWAGNRLEQLLVGVHEDAAREPEFVEALLASKLLAFHVAGDPQTPLITTVTVHPKLVENELASDLRRPEGLVEHGPFLYSFTSPRRVEEFRAEPDGQLMCQVFGVASYDAAELLDRAAREDCTLVVNCAVGWGARLDPDKLHEILRHRRSVPAPAVPA